MVIRRDEYLVTTARDLDSALKYFRGQAGVTQNAAAQAMGIGQPYLSALEGGKFGSSLTHALRLVRFVGCESDGGKRGHLPVAGRGVRPDRAANRVAGDRWRARARNQPIRPAGIGGRAVRDPAASGVTKANLLDEATSWGIGPAVASKVVTETLEQVITAIPTIAGDERVLAVIRQQTERISRS